MSKKIISVGYEIPGHSDDYAPFRSETSLADADIILFDTDTPETSYSDGTYNGLRSYADDGSFQYKTDTAHWKRELTASLEAGKTVFLLLGEKKDFHLRTGTREFKGKMTINHVGEHNNYEFLPVDIGTITNGKGQQVIFENEPIISEFIKHFGGNMGYRVYLRNTKGCRVLFRSKDRTRILGGIYKVGAGHIVALPYLDYDYEKFSKTKINKKGEESSSWVPEAMKFGGALVSDLIQIDRDLRATSEKTPPPDWINRPEFVTPKENGILEDIYAKEKEITEKKAAITQLSASLEEERGLKGLLYEQGKPLEQAVIKALRLLGYSAEGYDDGELELDQVIISPEGVRYIGESEGKNDRDVDISKLRQLIESMSADFAREEVSEKAYGILFGNPQRLIEPQARTLDFTAKCKSGASREGIALVKTADLYRVASYIAQTNDEQFKSECRKAIHDGLGEIIQFPEAPTKDPN